jgi:hypothetical protein
MISRKNKLHFQLGRRKKRLEKETKKDKSDVHWKEKVSK